MVVVPDPVPAVVDVVVVPPVVVVVVVEPSVAVVVVVDPLVAVVLVVDPLPPPAVVDVVLAAVVVLVVLDGVVVVVVVVVTWAAPTWMGATLPVGTTVKAPALADALLKNVPWLAGATTLKWSVTLLLGGMTKGPAHVNVCPLVVGSLGVSPVVDPGTYVNPDGSVSVIELTITFWLVGLVMVIV